MSCCEELNLIHKFIEHIYNLYAHVQNFFIEMNSYETLELMDCN